MHQNRLEDLQPLSNDSKHFCGYIVIQHVFNEKNPCPEADVLCMILSVLLLYDWRTDDRPHITSINVWPPPCCLEAGGTRWFMTKASLTHSQSTHPKHKEPKIFENHLNPVMLVCIGKLLRRTHR